MLQTTNLAMYPCRPWEKYSIYAYKHQNSASNGIPCDILWK